MTEFNEIVQSSDFVAIYCFLTEWNILPFDLFLTVDLLVIRQFLELKYLLIL